jgi:hypothetical protein
MALGYSRGSNQEIISLRVNMRRPGLQAPGYLSRQPVDGILRRPEEERLAPHP